MRNIYVPEDIRPLKVACAYYNAFTLCLWHLTYFCILCYYLRIKIRSLNISLEKRQNVMKVLISFNELYKEIEEYNTNFWSKYLLCIWSLLGFDLISAIFLIIFFSYDLIIKLLMIYSVVIEQ